MTLIKQFVAGVFLDASLEGMRAARGEWTAFRFGQQIGGHAHDIRQVLVCVLLVHARQRA